jgi:hypothetical protein
MSIEANGTHATASVSLPTYDDVVAAAQRIAGIAHRTPVLTSRTASEPACKQEDQSRSSDPPTAPPASQRADLEDRVDDRDDEQRDGDDHSNDVVLGRRTPAISKSRIVRLKELSPLIDTHRPRTPGQRSESGDAIPQRNHSD